jgi:hypothetical protein
VEGFVLLAFVIATFAVLAAAAGAYGADSRELDARPQIA